MSPQLHIRIVKRAAEKAAESRTRPPKDARSGARAVAENVSSWVEDFREQRSADSRRTFASLFNDAQSD